MDLENAADNGASLDELLDIVRSMDDPNDLYNVMDLCSGDSYEDNLLWNTAKTKRDTILSMTDRKGSCEHCERPDNLNTIAQSVVSGMSRKIGEPSRKGSRKGYTSVDGKSPMEYLKMLYDLQGFPSQQDVISHGSETDAEEYLKNNASFFGTGYEKYLRMIVEEYEKGLRDGSRKGAPAFATGNSGKIMNDVKGLINNPTVSTKLQKTFGTQDQRNQAILQEHNNEQAKIDRQNKVDQLRTGGSRKGSSLWTLKGSERQDLYNRIDAKLKSEGHPWDYVYKVTGKDYEDSAYSAFAEMPENKEWINGLILEITRDRNNY